MRIRINTGVPDISEVRIVLNHDMLQENLGIDSSIFFYYNLNVLSQLASAIDIISAKVATLEMMTAVDSHLHSSIISIGKQIESENGFESMNALATKVVALEAEASAKSIILQSFKIKHVLRVQLTASNLQNQIEYMDEEAQSFSHINTVRAQISSESERHLQQSNDDLNLIIESIKVVNALSLLGNSTTRYVIFFYSCAQIHFEMSDNSYLMLSFPSSSVMQKDQDNRGNGKC